MHKTEKKYLTSIKIGMSLLVVLLISIFFIDKAALLIVGENVTSYIQSTEVFTNANAMAISIAVGVIVILSLTISLLHTKNKNKHLKQAYNELLRKQYHELNIVQNKLKSSEAQRKIQDTAREKFLAIVAKDLKNPLLALKSYAYTLKTKEGNVSAWELKAYAGSLEKSLNHLIGILNNISRWTMVQNPLQPSKVDNINMNKMIAYTLRLMKTSADKKHIALVKNINCQVEIMGDAYMIEFILRNLVSNAIKYSTEGSVVMVKLRADENRLTLSVKDTGVGMDEATMGNLFKLQATNNAIVSGNITEAGLSLVLCHEFLQKMDGTIEVTSKPNEGSLFTVSLPRNVLQPHRVRN